MVIYTYSKARQSLFTLLEQALHDGVVKIKRKDGQMFVLKPEKKTDSPLDVEGVDLNLSSKDIVSFIHDGRKV